MPLTLQRIAQLERNSLITAQGRYLHERTWEVMEALRPCPTDEAIGRQVKRNLKRFFQHCDRLPEGYFKQAQQESLELRLAKFRINSRGEFFDAGRPTPQASAPAAKPNGLFAEASLKQRQARVLAKCTWNIVWPALQENPAGCWKARDIALMVEQHGIQVKVAKLAKAMKAAPDLFEQEDRKGHRFYRPLFRDRTGEVKAS